MLGNKFSAFMCLLCTILWIGSAARAYKSGQTGDLVMDVVLAIVFAVLMVWAWTNKPKSKK